MDETAAPPVTASTDDDVAAQLVAANAILVRQGILDAFGHVSARSVARPETFLLSRNLAPGQVTAVDVQTYALDATTDDERPGYLERYLHAEIYRARPDVGGIVHSHAGGLIPFGITATPLLPVAHMASFLGPRTPVFEIRDARGEGSDLLVTDRASGADLAATLGSAAVVLMRGHGSCAVGEGVPEAVFRAIYADVNARIQLAAAALGAVTALSSHEAAASAAANAGQITRAWNVWAADASTTRT